MKTKLVALLVAALFASAGTGFSAEPTAAATDLQNIVSKIKTKLNEGKPTEAGLAPELKEFDALLQKYKTDKSDDVAMILLTKSVVYSDLLHDEAKGDAVMQQLKRDFPDSEAVATVKRQEESKKVRADLVKGAAFPDFEEKDLDGKPLSISGLKGKVVLVDFWATWCGPCIFELPNVLTTYEKHHAKGFEIVGISFDSDRKKLESFIKQKSMPWPQFFDGKGWENKLGKNYSVNNIPLTFLLDRESKIIGIDLRGDSLESAVAAALAQK